MMNENSARFYLLLCISLFVLQQFFFVIVGFIARDHVARSKRRWVIICVKLSLLLLLLWFRLVFSQIYDVILQIIFILFFHRFFFFFCWSVYLKVVKNCCRSHQTNKKGTTKNTPITFVMHTTLIKVYNNEKHSHNNKIKNRSFRFVLFALKF